MLETMKAGLAAEKPTQKKTPQKKTQKKTTQSVLLFFFVDLFSPQFCWLIRHFWKKIEKNHIIKKRFILVAKLKLYFKKKCPKKNPKKPARFFFFFKPGFLPTLPYLLIPLHLMVRGWSKKNIIFVKTFHLIILSLKFWKRWPPNPPSGKGDSDGKCIALQKWNNMYFRQSYYSKVPDIDKNIAQGQRMGGRDDHFQFPIKEGNSQPAG